MTPSEARISAIESALHAERQSSWDRFAMLAGLSEAEVSFRMKETMLSAIEVDVLAVLTRRGESIRRVESLRFSSDAAPETVVDDVFNWLRRIATEIPSSPPGDGDEDVEEEDLDEEEEDGVHL